MYCSVFQCVAVFSLDYMEKKSPGLDSPKKGLGKGQASFPPFQKRGCCSVLQCVAGCYRLGKKMDQPIFNGTSLDSMYGVGMINRYMGCVAACCSVLQRVAACCSVLHCVADYDE